MSRPLFRQVTGGGSRIVMYRETTPGVVDTADPGVVLAIHSDSISVSSNRTTSSVITGRRGAGKPVAGQPDYSGGLVLAAYAAQTGHLLRALCGAPESEAVESFTLSAGAVTNEGDGLVGLPAVKSPFVQDCAVTILGTQNYNGTYRLMAGTSEDKLVISAVYKAETLTASAVAHRGRSAFFEGDARDLGDGKVALPIGGVGTSLSTGDTVTIEGSTNYDGSHVLAEGTNSNRLVIEAAYKAESFDGTAVGIPAFYRHHFKLPKVQPTVTIVKELDFEEGAAKEPYHIFYSCKSSGFNFSLGDDGEIRLDTSFSIGASENRATRVNADLEPLNLSQNGWANKDSAMWLSGKRLGDIATASITQDYAIERSVAIGDQGKAYRQSEGDPTCNVGFNAFLEHDEYQQLADNDTTVRLDISFDSAIGDEFWLTVPEGVLDSKGPKVEGKGGITQDFTFMGFVDQGETLTEYVLINRVASYA